MCMRQSQVPQGKQKAPEAATVGLREHHLNNLLNRRGVFPIATPPKRKKKKCYGVYMGATPYENTGHSSSTKPLACKYGNSR